VTNDSSGTPADWTPDPGAVPQPSPTGATASGRRQHRKARKAAAAQGGRKRRRWLRRTAIGTSVLVVLALLLAAGGWWYVNYRINQIPTVKVKGLEKAKPGQPLNILLVGSDTRSFCTTASCQSHLGNQGNSGGQRSDVIIILRLVPADRGLEMLSIPRDTWVSIADSGGQTNRINAAFNTGPSQLVKTIEQDFRIPINYYAYANFLGFTNVVQALGGIWMDFPDPVRDAETGLNIKKTGCQFLNGVEALQLVRSRDLYYYANGQWNVDGLGDLSRIRRQESFFHAIIDKADSDRNPIQINDFIQNAVRNIEIDPGLKSNLLNLALTFRGVASANLHTEVMPTSGAVYNGADILLLTIGTTKAKSTTGSTSPTTSTSTTTTTSLAVTGTTTVPIVDNAKNYPEPWNPVPCSP
jgi:LCP family protein required for cell wall assembly